LYVFVGFVLAWFLRLCCGGGGCVLLGFACVVVLIVVFCDFLGLGLGSWVLLLLCLVIDRGLTVSWVHFRRCFDWYGGCWPDFVNVGLFMGCR